MSIPEKRSFLRLPFMPLCGLSDAEKLSPELPQARKEVGTLRLRSGRKVGPTVHRNRIQFIREGGGGERARGSRVPVNSSSQALLPAKSKQDRHH